MGLIDIGLKLGLDQVKNSLINPKLAGIGVIEDLSYKDKKLFARLSLSDMEDHPLEVMCEDITLAQDGSTVIINKFTANKKFLQTALDRYVAGRPVKVPEGKARLAVMGAKKLLKL